MAEDKVETRETSWRQLFPWTEIFRAFGIAFDANKLLLAAAGILVTAIGWWLLAVLFSNGYGAQPNTWPGAYMSTGATPEEAWTKFKRDREEWNLMHEAASLGKSDGLALWEVADLAESPAEYDAVKDAVGPDSDPDRYKLDALDALIKPASEKAASDPKRPLDASKVRVYKARLGKPKPEGLLAHMPWTEDRGPNPYLLATGQAGIPWEPGQFWDWFTRDQAPVLIEPLIKLVRPILYFFSPRAQGIIPKLYFPLVFAWTVATWSLFGGAITRIAVVQVARPGEPIGLTEAFKFAWKNFLSYVAAPLMPLGLVFVLLLFSVIFGVFYMIPFIGDIFVAGLFWGIVLLLAVAMAVSLLGLAVGWPLMAPTISAEGTDSWEALSRSISYVFQRPWHYLFYSSIALLYGAVVIFFVGFMGSFTVYLSKYAVAQTPLSQTFNREPSHLFIYAPPSFGWQALLLQGTKDADGKNVVQFGKVDPDAYKRYVNSLNWWNKVGAGLVAVWIGLVFLLVLGFGYSFFFTTTTIIYLLLRRDLDSAEIDEVYLEDEEPEPFVSPSPTLPPEAPKSTTPLQMVEAPTMRPVAPPIPPPAPPPSAAETLIAPPVSPSPSTGIGEHTGNS